MANDQIVSYPYSPSPTIVRAVDESGKRVTFVYEGLAKARVNKNGSVTLTGVSRMESPEAEKASQGRQAVSPWGTLVSREGGGEVYEYVKPKSARAKRPKGGAENKESRKEARLG